MSAVNDVLADGGLKRLVDTGAEAVVLVPLPEKGLDELEIFAELLLPSLK